MNGASERVKRSAQLIHDPRKLKRQRIVARLGLRKAAAKAGISPAFLSYLESGERSPSPETLGALADAYGCPIADLMPPERKGAAA